MIGPPRVARRDLDLERSALLAAEAAAPAPGYASRVTSRLGAGHLLYGDRWHTLTLEDLLHQIAEEASDVGTWGVLALQAWECDRAQRWNRSLPLALRCAIAGGAHAHRLVADVSPAACVATVNPHPDFRRIAAGPRNITRERVMLELAEQATGVSGFTEHCATRLAQGEELYGARWMAWGLRRLVRELTIETLDLGGWSVLALQHPGCEQEGCAGTLRSILWSAAHSYGVLEAVCGLGPSGVAQ